VHGQEPQTGRLYFDHAQGCDHRAVLIP
jgi:hypothetical protein